MRHRPSRSGLRLKGLKRYRRGDADYVYHRATGIRLPDLPENHPEFLKAYIAAEDGPSRPTRSPAGSIEAVCSAYVISPAFKALSKSYGALMRREAAKITEKAGPVPFKQLRRSHIEKDISEMDTHAANRRLKAWRGICKFAMGKFHKENPTEGVKPIPVPKSQGHLVWAATDITAFRTKWVIGTRERLAFELIYWTGARMSDAVRLGRGNVDAEGWLSFTQQKTGGSVSIPFDRAPPGFADPADLTFLKNSIAASPSHLAFIVTSYGSSRSHKSASQWFAKAARSAGIKGRTAHGLRKARATYLAEHGATTHQIAAWTGHESLKEIEHYSRTAEKKRLLSGAEGEHKLSNRSNP